MPVGMTRGQRLVGPRTLASVRPLCSGGTMVSSRAKLAVTAVLAIILVAPFATMQLPGLGDTLNHLARMHILRNIAHSPALADFYSVQWSAIPYLAMDAVVPPLAWLVGLPQALKIFVIACALMPFIGAASLHYALHRRISLVPAAAFLIGGNYLLALGFLNYLFSLGLAVTLFAGWVATTAWNRGTRTVLFTVATTLLYFGHAFAFAGYGCAVAGFEIGWAVRRKFRPPRRVALDWICAALQAAPALLAAATLNAAQGAPGKLYSFYGEPGEKLLALASPALFLADTAQLGVLAAGLLLLGLCLPHLRCNKAVWPAVVAVALAAAAMPEILLSTWLTDFRLPLFAATLLLGSLSFTGSRLWSLVLAGALAVLLAVKSYDMWRSLRTLDAQEAEMADVLTALPTGARLLVANESADAPGRAELAGSTIWNMPLLAVIDRDAFVPYLFTGITTVHVRPDVAASSTPQGQPVTLAQLQAELDGKPPPLSPVEQREGLKIYWHRWTGSFDYLLIEHFHRALADPFPGRLTLVKQSADISLYRIAR
jgi:hypothetical protein